MQYSGRQYLQYSGRQYMQYAGRQGMFYSGRQDTQRPIRQDVYCCGRQDFTVFLLPGFTLLRPLMHRVRCVLTSKAHSLLAARIWHGLVAIATGSFWRFFIIFLLISNSYFDVVLL
jgi:hypothetical protein